MRLALRYQEYHGAQAIEVNESPASLLVDHNQGEGGN
jgi:hypothetical protein